jgi:RNA polymerase sigma-70 factor, ECF subfamily
MNEPNNQLPAMLKIEEELEWINKAKLDPKDFAPLYQLHFEAVFRFIYHRLNDKQTSKDITQQAFINALINIKKFQYKGFSIKSWLFRIAVNELNKFYGKVKTERCINIYSEGLSEILFDVKENNEVEQDEALFEVLKKLNEDQLILVEMRYFEKRSFAEIGDILGITENNAKVKLYRIIDFIKPLMKNI